MCDGCKKCSPKGDACPRACGEPHAYGDDAVYFFNCAAMSERGEAIMALASALYEYGRIVDADVKRKHDNRCSLCWLSEEAREYLDAVAQPVTNEGGCDYNKKVQSEISDLIGVLALVTFRMKHQLPAFVARGLAKAKCAAHEQPADEGETHG